MQLCKTGQLRKTFLYGMAAPPPNFGGGLPPPFLTGKTTASPFQQQAPRPDFSSGPPPRSDSAPQLSMMSSSSMPSNQEPYEGSLMPGPNFSNNQFDRPPGPNPGQSFNQQRYYGRYAHHVFASASLWPLVCVIPYKHACVWIFFRLTDSGVNIHTHSVGRQGARGVSLPGTTPIHQGGLLSIEETGRQRHVVRRVVDALYFCTGGGV
jgi:hypothetical protein